MKNHLLTESKIGNAKVVVDILKFGLVVKDVRMSSIKYITIHDTGNTAPAKNQHSCMNNWNKNGERKASWHISCDSDYIYQGVKFNNRCLHTRTTNGNNTSIGIEISQSNNAENQKQAYLNAIALCKILMKEYNIPLSNVVQHNYWSGKNCPINLRSNKFNLNWNWFKDTLKNHITGTSNSNTTNDNSWVLKLQKELNTQGFRDKNNKKLIEDGIKGPSTLSACPVVKEGARGNITKLIQEKLETNTDGIFGSGTKSKVIAYQKSKGLSSDGIVGKNTWSKMLNM